MTFEQIYDQQFSYVYRTLRRLGVSPAEADDATQEVFLVVHRKLAEFEGRAKLRTWIFSICYRHASERRRRAHVRLEVMDEAAVDRSVDPADDQAVVLSKKEAVALLEQILERMSLEQRAVFTLYELEGLEGDDISRALELPRGTVYSRLRAAREIFARAVDRLRTREEFARSTAGGVA